MSDVPLNQDISIKTTFGSIILQPHQVFTTRLAMSVPELLVYHEIGSGKTPTAISICENLFELYGSDISATDKVIDRALVVVPAKLRINFKEQLEKLGISVDKYQIVSYDFVANNKQKIGDTSTTIIVMDEVHRLRNESTKTTKELTSISLKCPNILMLSGTPLVNSPADMATLANILHRERVLPVVKQVFDNKFIMKDLTGREIGMKNIPILMDTWKGKASYFATEKGFNENFPTVENITIKVPMYDLQHKLYKDFERQELTLLTRQMLDAVIESSALNAFFSRTRQLSNTAVGLVSEDEVSNSFKFRGIGDDILKGPGPVVVFSNFIKSGIVPFSEYLKEIGVTKFATVTGSTSDAELERNIENYNKGKLDVLLISQALKEGVTLLNTRQLHIMEPGFNFASKKQIIGRVARFKSHAQLPLDERKVLVTDWLSVKPSSSFGPRTGASKSVDEYLISLSERKQRMVDFGLRIMQLASFEENPSLSIPSLNIASSLT